jgi:hypothetical protein
LMRRLVTCVCRRSASFFYLFLESLIGETGVTEDRKTGPTPALPWTEPVSRLM